STTGLPVRNARAICGRSWKVPVVTASASYTVWSCGPVVWAARSVRPPPNPLEGDGDGAGGVETTPVRTEGPCEGGSDGATAMSLAAGRFALNRPSGS